MTIQNIFSAASGVVEAPDLWEKRLPKKFADICPRLVETKDGVAWTAAHQIGGTPHYRNSTYNVHATEQKKMRREDVAQLATPKGRREIQDRDEVAGEVLYSIGDVWDMINASANDEFITVCYSAYNDWLAEFCAADPQRFVGIAKIPTTGIKWATGELKRAAENLGLKGAILDVWPGGLESPPAMKECDSFWEAAAALKIPVSINKALDGSKEDKMLVEPGMPPAYHLSLNAIIYANIPDRFPDIRLVSLAPNAGWAPALFEQINETYMRTAALRKVNLGDPDLYPSDYLRRFVWYVTQDDRTALLNRSYFGEHHMMWGSFSFMGDDSVWPNTRQLFERLTSGIPDSDKQVLASDVVSRLYGIANSRPFTAEELKKFDRYSLM